MRHALSDVRLVKREGYTCVCRRCGQVFAVDDRAHQRARRFCSHACYVANRRETEHNRDEAIRLDRTTGASLREIAARHSLSAERIRQICQLATASRLPEP